MSRTCRRARSSSPAAATGAARRGVDRDAAPRVDLRRRAPRRVRGGRPARRPTTPTGSGTGARTRYVRSLDDGHDPHGQRDRGRRPRGGRGRLARPSTSTSAATPSRSCRPRALERGRHLGRRAPTSTRARASARRRSRRASRAFTTGQPSGASRSGRDVAHVRDGGLARPAGARRLRHAATWPTCCRRVAPAAFMAQLAARRSTADGTGAGPGVRARRRRPAAPRAGVTFRSPPRVLDPDRHERAGVVVYGGRGGPCGRRQLRAPSRPRARRTGPLLGGQRQRRTAARWCSGRPAAEPAGRRRGAAQEVFLRAGRRATRNISQARAARARTSAAGSARTSACRTR